MSSKLTYMDNKHYNNAIIDTRKRYDNKQYNNEFIQIKDMIKVIHINMS